MTQGISPKRWAARRLEWQTTIITWRKRRAAGAEAPAAIAGGNPRLRGPVHGLLIPLYNDQMLSLLDNLCAPSGITAMEDGTLLITDVYNKVVWQVKGGATGGRSGRRPRR